MKPSSQKLASQQSSYQPSWFDSQDDIFARLAKLHPKKIDLSLGRIERVLAALGHPEKDLPPIIHVAGTNGKGSTIAFLNALAQAMGKTAHIYTSPHLMHFSERIVIGGHPIKNDAMVKAVERVERANQGKALTFFEAMTAAAFLAFRDHQADFCLLETGLGGRLDATNLVKPKISIITPISYDHQAFLGESLAEIAGEKAGIIKPKTILVSASQPKPAFEVIEKQALSNQAPFFYQGRDWHIKEKAGEGFDWSYRDSSLSCDLPAPSLSGDHQYQNASLALFAFRKLNPSITPADIAKALRAVTWRGRLQKITYRGRRMFLDGGHNPSAGQALADFIQKSKVSAPFIYWSR